MDSILRELSEEGLLRKLAEARSEIERLHGELAKQECDTASWKERAEKVSADLADAKEEIAFLTKELNNASKRLGEDF